MDWFCTAMIVGLGIVACIGLGHGPHGHRDDCPWVALRRAAGPVPEGPGAGEE